MKKEDWNRLLFILLIFLGIYAVGYSFWETKILRFITTVDDFRPCLSAVLELNQNSTCWDNSSQELYVSIKKKDQDNPVPIKGFQLILYNNHSRSVAMLINENTHENIKMQDKSTFKLPTIDNEKSYVVSMSGFPDIIKGMVAPTILMQGKIRICPPTSSIGINPCPVFDNGKRFVDGINKIVSENDKEQIQDMLDDTSYAFIIVNLNDTMHMDEVLSSLPSKEFIVWYAWESIYAFSGNATKGAIIKLQNNPYVKDIHATGITIAE